jgi:bacteriochlorophyll C8 methyltransferase
MIQMYPTRGCPLSCTFCVVPTYYGGHGKTSRSHRCRDVGDVCDEIEYLAAKYPNFQGCYFNEEAHSANPEWLAAFCEELIRRGLNRYQYDAMCGMWSFTPELVKLCAAAGYRQIRFGMESTSEAVGKAIKKTIHKDKTEQFLGWLKEAGIGAYCTIQVGAMGSNETSDLATIGDVKEWIRRGMIQKWQISTSTPQPSTPFYDLAKDSGWLVTDDINEYDGMRAVVSFPLYPANRIQAVRNGAGL